MVTEPSLTDDDRAQLVLVGSVAIAFIVISLVVVFNTVLFTNNLAASGSVEEVEDASTFQQQVERETPELVRHVENGTGSNDELVGNVDENVTGAYSELLAESYADTSPKYADVRFNRSSTVNGTRVVQEDGGEFRNDTNATSWSPITSSDPRNISHFEANVSTSGLTDVGSLNYTIVLRGQGAEDPVEIQIASDGSTLLLNQAQGSDVNICSMSGDYVRVNVTNGSLPNGCTFNSTNVLTGPYSMEFQNADRVSGNYSFVVNGTGYDSRPDYNVRNGDDPYANVIILKAGVDLTFESRTVTYESNQTVTVREGPQ
ncbi:hypothetical protein BRD03_08250 [Halobacteriales archaeon QS_9_68_17]|nr:MAG: hypothetical protein BRD03_08250 [Halobacteriales archaeon QS_9_68_17]